MKKVIVTLIGLINPENYVLISKRKNNAQFNGFWEYPGGKVEVGESIITSLLRETREELGLNLNSSCISPLTFSIDKSKDQETTLLLFVCRKWTGQPQNIEGQELVWIKPLDLNRYKMPPANIFLNSILRDWVGIN